jgi:hypothetical protein
MTESDDLNAARISVLEGRLYVLDKIADTLDYYIGLLENGIREESFKHMPEDTGRHGYVPLSRPWFLTLLARVLEELGGRAGQSIYCDSCGSETVRRATFIDVGSGLGDKVALAQCMGFEAHGVEINEFLVKKANETVPFRVTDAKKYLAPPVTAHGAEAPPTLYIADALTFDYRGFDVIYYYRPFSDMKLEEKLEKRIWQQAKPGAFVVASLMMTQPPPTFERITNPDGTPPLPDNCWIYRRRKKSKTTRARKRSR